MGNGTSIGRVRALGSAHSGTHHWLVQRFTAIGNLVLGLFLLVSLVLQHDRSFPAMVAWAGSPLPALALALFVVTSFWHARLGLQVLIEDYVRDHANKFACIALLNLATFAGAAAGLFFIARMVMAAIGHDVAGEVVGSTLRSTMGGR